MKSVVRILWVCLGVVAMTGVQAQNKIDDERMARDIEVAENVLGTLVKQQFGKRNFFPFEVKGNYMPGYGVTFNLPMDFGGPMMYMISDEPNIVLNSGQGGSYSYSYSVAPQAPREPREPRECEDCDDKKVRSKAKAATFNKIPKDSLAGAYNEKILEASKNFIADYGDLIGQLGPNEKIVITNRNEGQHFWYAGADMPKRKYLSLEASRGDITSFKQGKINRDQLLAKITVVDSETMDELSPDLELLSSIFNRLYRSDLSKTYYVQENIYYERLKDYGVIYYMQVYSSNENEFRKFFMPTVDLQDIDKATRDKKVAELYPAFEKDIKESVLDYGRTLKSLKDNEVLVVHVKLTKCDGCGIPSNLELSIKYSALKEYDSGKASKEASLAKMTVKKGPNQ